MSRSDQNIWKDLKKLLRRKGLKLLALGERARVALLRAWDRGLDLGEDALIRFLDGWDKVWDMACRAGRRVKRHPVSPLLYVAVLAVAVGAIGFNRMYTQAYVLTVDGVELGMLADEAQVEAIVNNVETRAASILGEDYDYEGTIEITPAIAAAGDFSDAAEVEDTMFAGVGALVEACAVSVDGVELGYAPTREEMQALLDRVAEPYLTEKAVRYDFVENVRIYSVELPANTEYRLEDLYAVLTDCTVEEAYYTVEKGDTFNQIAYELGMTPADLSDLNQGININQLLVGQELVIRQAVPFLSVCVYTNETYEEVIESPIEYIETASLYVGSTSVKEEGEDGLALVNADVRYVNGYEVERTINSSQTLVEPTTTYLYTGTTPRPKTASNGYYTWPVRGTLTSYYGGRYLSGVYDFHLGIDIANAYGTTIRAADGGTVTFAGWKGSYGYLVIITHDNGSQTYYGHNSSLLVRAGDKVYQGQPIARMGSTGNSTGPHCHFEIRINGRTVNPLNYL